MKRIFTAQEKESIFDAWKRGFQRRSKHTGGDPSTVAPNLLNRGFSVTHPNQVWVKDITYIRTYDGWLFLGVVSNLFSRQVIGWSMGQRINTDLVLDALTMAIWRRNPNKEVVVHSDQGCQLPKTC